MRTTWNVGAAVAAAGPSGGAGPGGSGPGGNAARQSAGARTQITGEDAELGKIFELIEDAGHTKPLLAEAVKIAKEKDQPFNVNATLILARTAQLLRQTDDSATSSTSSTSTRRRSSKAPRESAKGYSGLIKTLYDGGKYEDSDKACEDFLAFKGEPAVQRTCNGSYRRCFGRWC